jgi:acetylornithine/N-succinyldiaminopimelate aminotransferase
MNHILECSGYGLVKTDIVRGENCYLYDTHDNMYVDFEAGVWCTSLGHNHPRINQTIATQIGRITHLGFRYTNKVVEDAAVKVLETVEFYDGKCVFLSSGSEAVEFGVQIARQISEQPLFITLSNSYLSAFGDAGKKRSDGWYCFDWSKCNTCQLPGCDLQCHHLTEIPLERIGGLVFEPGNTCGLVKFPPKKLVKTLEFMIKQRNGLIVIDEVTTGLGRTGSWYGFQHYDLQPDIIAMGKGIGNGYPVSAIAMKRDIALRLEKVNFRYAQSHQNDALGCAVAKEVITIIQEEDLVERSKILGARFLDEMKLLEQRNNNIKEVRGRGLMLALEFKSNSEDFSLATVYGELVKKGFLVGYIPSVNLLRFYPALTIKEDDIKNLLDVLSRVLNKMKIKFCV